MDWWPEHRAVTLSSVCRGEAAWRTRWKLWQSPPMWQWRSTSPIGSSAPGDPQGIQTPSAVKVWSQHASCITCLNLFDQHWLQWVSLPSCRRLRRIPLSAKEEALLPGLWLLVLFFFCQSLVMCCHMDDQPFRFSFFQVGVLSWGITDVCQQIGRKRVPPHARDFHIDLFQILPWLKQHLGKDVQFLPEIPWSHKITSGWISSCLPKKTTITQNTLLFCGGPGSCWIITQPTILILNITIFISVFCGDERLIYHKIKWNIWQKTSIISSISCHLLDFKKNPKQNR